MTQPAIEWIDNTTSELAGAWWPVAWSHEVTDRPVAVQLLGRHLVPFQVGQRRGLGVRAHVGPHNAAALHAGVALDVHARTGLRKR